MLDIALLVPYQPIGTSWVDPAARNTYGASKLIALEARDRFFEYLKIAPGGGVREETRERSLTAVALSTCLERAGLSWYTLDPAGVGLEEWRHLLVRLRAKQPRLVAVSSTFVNDGFWLGALVALVRKILPEAKVAVGGYYYATSSKEFLSLDADILCVGEGEVRIVSITEAVRDGRPLEGIPGLYLRDGRGGLRYTGNVEPLRLDDLPMPDWSLSSRIEPPVDLRHHPIPYHVETQRGCVFKCQFCTFRTLAAPVLGSIERGVDVILDAGRGRGNVWLIDGTATYPRERWRTLLERLIERGGSPLPMHVYARVSDLDEEICALMARAGVRFVLIGQESGDQRVLNAIRKGTKVKDLRPAIAALGRHRIEPSVSFILGFPGEDAESIATTRRLIATINDGYESSPVVRGITLRPMTLQDFAGVRNQMTHDGVTQRYDWNNAGMSSARAAEEALECHIELSRIPHAPTTGFDGIVPLHQMWLGRRTGNDLSYFWWAKAIDRGIGMFAVEATEGRKPDPRALKEVGDQVLERLPPDVRNPSRAKRLMGRARNRATWIVLSEWAKESTSHVGALTRLALGREVMKVTGEAGLAISAVRSGQFPALGFLPASETKECAAEAEKLVQLGVATGARRLVRAG